MEKILTLRGLLFGALGGLVAWVFMYLMAEPIIDRAIGYEEARSEAMEALEHSHGAMGHAHGGEEEVFSRTIQQTVGAGVGMVVLGLALGGIAAVVLAVWLHYRGDSAASARRYAIPVAVLTFGALYVLPIIKYPANPPAVGNEDTIQQRTGLFLAMIAISAVVVLIGVVVRQRLRARGLGEGSLWIAAGVVVVLMVLAYWLMPSLGSLSANAELHSAFETPGPVTDTDGTILLPGFDADDLYLFRLYSLIAQVIIWVSIAGGLTLGAKRVDAARSTTTDRPLVGTR